jgi:hypothetical protein
MHFPASLLLLLHSCILSLIPHAVIGPVLLIDFYSLLCLFSCALGYSTPSSSCRCDPLFSAPHTVSFLSFFLLVQTSSYIILGRLDRGGLLYIITSVLGSISLTSFFLFCGSHIPQLPTHKLLIATLIKHLPNFDLPLLMTET